MHQCQELLSLSNQQLKPVTIKKISHMANVTLFDQTGKEAGPSEFSDGIWYRTKMNQLCLMQSSANAPSSSRNTRC